MCAVLCVDSGKGLITQNGLCASETTTNYYNKHHQLTQQCTEWTQIAGGTPNSFCLIICAQSVGR